MTFLKHDSSTFAADAARGFVRAHSDAVQSVFGGVVRTTRSAEDEVALVIGGGSGHYPAFAGLVGPGLAHGAVLGNIFASPSARQVESVARTVEQGRGVLLSYGNYAGDKLQFDEASAALEATGIEVRTVRVTDDISSAPESEIDKRRGIAGDLVVFKVAGAAAAAGKDLDEVHRLAALANDRTRSVGVAFTGCVLPGSDEPLFSVPRGRMAVGMGIHGEAGLDEVDVPTPAELAELFVTKLLAESVTPDRGSRRAVVIVNGLGAFKNDEMYVLLGHVMQQLDAENVEVADIKVGEFCTSFEMAGVSLTLCWVDSELEELWKAAAQSPAYSEGSVSESKETVALEASAADADEALPDASEESRRAASRVAELLQTVARVVDEHAEELGRVDAIAGDGDHGIGMQHGSHAASEAAVALTEQGAGAGTLLKRVGDAWQDGAGGTSGALWGAMLRAIGGVLGDDDTPSVEQVKEGVSAAAEAVQSMGGAMPGDKTMVDALAPFAETLANTSDYDLAAAWGEAASAARNGADATTDMMPGLGRARSHGDKAVGVADPGALSFALIVEALTEELKQG
ncbi:dihydroxyacetone kinase family protein [uncultured Tessaracoccus sp.]|uniref:dihydroxyacetone kinase family protein n=1 Tax=uncultured Tessaracoccus sp. TaxID=905023 RepID=UPI002639CC06|nr:dihydroxyacetone kinase family protein [uncultured Tessaracoccus sp.]